jgi:hypothetical protein
MRFPILYYPFCQVGKFDNITKADVIITHLLSFVIGFLQILLILCICMIINIRLILYIKFMGTIIEISLSFGCV